MVMPEKKYGRVFGVMRYYTGWAVTSSFLTNGSQNFNQTST